MGVGVGTWLLVRQPGPQRTRDQRVFARPPDPGRAVHYCNVLNLDDCETPETQGELPVSERYPVQLSVPDAIYRAPWRLLQVYEDPANTTSTMFRPGTRFAVTIPSVDPHRGRLTGIVVQLLTLVVDPGQLNDIIGPRCPARGMVSAADLLAVAGARGRGRIRLRRLALS